MPPAFRYPAKPERGDAVAVLSPSGRSAARFPLPLDLGLTRLRDEFGLEPVEYPTTRAAQASPAERAADIHAAFADPGIRAVLTTIGGDDQLRVLAHLDSDLLAANPKPFFGYSDSVNLLMFLWNLGLVSYQAVPAPRRGLRRGDPVPGDLGGTAVRRLRFPPADVYGRAGPAAALRGRALGPPEGVVL